MSLTKSGPSQVFPIGGNGQDLNYSLKVWCSKSMQLTVYSGQDMDSSMPVDRRMDKDVVHIYNGIWFSHKKRIKSCHLQQHAWTQFSSVTQSCPTLCDPTDCNTPGFPVLHKLPELAQTHVHRVSDAIQPSHPLSSPSPPSCLQSFPASGCFPLSQFFASGGQSIRVSASVLPMNIQDWFPLGLTGLITLQSKELSRMD